MTDVTQEINEISEIETPRDTAEPLENPSARLFTAAEMAERLTDARARWEAESAAQNAAAKDAAFADGQAAAAAAAAVQIAQLQQQLTAAQSTAARRETEIRCGRMLRERALDEEMAHLLLAPGETDVTDEVLLARVSALSGAVEAAAIRALREKTAGIHPGTGTSAPLTGRIIRDMPVSRLAEIMK